MNLLYVARTQPDLDALTLALAKKTPGARLVWAATIREACLRLEEDPRPDAVLAEAPLPDGNVLSLIARIRKSHQTIPMIVVSPPDEGDPAAALKAGADDYLTRDGRFAADLPQVLERVLDRNGRASQRAANPLRVLYVGDAELAKRCFEAEGIRRRVGRVLSVPGRARCGGRSRRDRRRAARRLGSRCGSDRRSRRRALSGGMKCAIASR